MLPQQCFYFSKKKKKLWASRATGNSLLPTFCQFPVTFLYSFSPYPPNPSLTTRTHSRSRCSLISQTLFPLLLAKIRRVRYDKDHLIDVPIPLRPLQPHAFVFYTLNNTFHLTTL